MSVRMVGIATALGLAAFASLIGPVAYAEDPIFSLVVKDHRFTPDELQIPAGVKVKLMVRNDDPTPEEFESVDLHREKLVPSGTEVPVYIGPLDPGTYGFFGDFNQQTAQGRIIAK